MSENVQNDDSVEDIEPKTKDIKRPKISHFEDAIEIVEGKPKLKVSTGGKLMIERSVDYGGSPKWLDTRTYLVKSVNSDTGAMTLWDIDSKNFAMSNINAVSNPLYQFKIPSEVKSKKRFVSEDKPLTEKKVSGEKLRTVYVSRGRIHTRIKSIAFGPDVGVNSSAKNGDRIEVKQLSMHEIEVSTQEWKEIWKNIQNF